MSKRYPGNFITGNPVALSQTSNNGIWDVTDVSAAVAAGTWQEPDGIYEIPRSLRFRSSATAYLNRTPTTAGNTKTWTWSGWVKRGTLGSQQALFNAGVTAGQQISGIAFSSGSGVYDKLELWSGIQGVSTEAHCQSLAFYRDPSAWYHIVVAVDTTQSISSNRVKLYVNGSALSIAAYASYNTYPSQNYAYAFNNTVAHQIARDTVGTPNYFDGHLTEVNFIDGQALDPSYFGYFDLITNIWQPKRYTGGYGTNGFYLPFTDNTSVQTLGRNYVTNAVANNNNIAAGTWVKNNCTAVANNAVAPDGTTTASSFVEGSTAANNWINQICTGFNTISGNVYTISFYVKPVNRSWIMLQNDNFTHAGGGRPRAYFNLSGEGAVGSTNAATNASILRLPNGWYRCTYTTAASTANENFYVAIYTATADNTLVSTGNGLTAVHVWGFAANAGSSLNTVGNVPFNASAPVLPTGGGDWTPNNFSLTAGTTYDSMIDSPTNVFTTATDTGGVVSGNYCTLNSLNKSTGGGTLSEGNLRITTTGGNHTVCGTMAFPPSGKWYFEAIDTITGGNSAVGILQQNQSLETNVVSANINMKYNNMADNATFGFAVNMDNLTYTWYKNGVVASSGSASTGSLVAGVTYVPFCMTSGGGGASTTFNFGQRPFAYTPPAGYKSLNTTNIQALGTSGVGNAAITPHKWFDINLYGGTGTPRTITNSGFQPDLVWTKVRNTTYSHNIADSVRGAGVRMYSDGSAAEGSNPNGGVTSFNIPTNNGYTIDGGVEVNEAGRPYVAWQWKQSPTSGFNIVTYTGTGVARTISHNLGSDPKMMIIKRRSAAADWIEWHTTFAGTDYLALNLTNAKYTASPAIIGTAPTSSVFSVGTSGAVNGSGDTYIAYLWAEVPGFSKFGTYTGNGSTNGAFVYTGFRPRWVMYKRTDTTSNWVIVDTARSTVNETTVAIVPNSTSAETTGVGNYDILSNGFKCRNVIANEANVSGGTYIFAAFAESPFALNNRAR